MQLMLCRNRSFALTERGIHNLFLVIFCVHVTGYDEGRWRNNIYLTAYRVAKVKHKERHIEFTVKCILE